MNPITNRFIDADTKESINQVCESFEQKVQIHLNPIGDLSEYIRKTRSQINIDIEQRYLVDPRYASKVIDIPDVTADIINHCTLAQLSLVVISILNAMITDLNNASESETDGYCKRLESALYNYTKLYNTMSRTTSSWPFYTQGDVENLLKRKVRLGFES